MSRDLHSAGSAARPVWLQLFDASMAEMGQTDPSIFDAKSANSFLHMALIGQVRSDATSIAEAVAFIRATDPTNLLEFIVPEGVNADVLESFTIAGVTLMTAAEHQAAHPEQHPEIHKAPAADLLYAIYNGNADLIDSLIANVEREIGGEVSESKGDDLDAQ